MNVIKKRLKFAVLTVAVLGAFSFGAVQAVSSNDAEFACPKKPGCEFGGQRIGCCLNP